MNLNLRANFKLFFLLKMNFFKKATKLEPEKFHVKIRCGAPDSRMDRLYGVVQYSDTGVVDQLSRENVLLRGCRIRNTAFVEGMVLYTGECSSIVILAYSIKRVLGKDTKLMLSNGIVKYKRSSVERTTNYFIFIYVLLLGFLVVSFCLA